MNRRMLVAAVGAVVCAITLAAQAPPDTQPKHEGPPQTAPAAVGRYSVVPVVVTLDSSPDPRMSRHDFQSTLSEAVQTAIKVDHQTGATWILVTKGVVKSQWIPLTTKPK